MYANCIEPELEVSKIGKDVVVLRGILFGQRISTKLINLRLLVLKTARFDERTCIC